MKSGDIVNGKRMWRTLVRVNEIENGLVYFSLTAQGNEYPEDFVLPLSWFPQDVGERIYNADTLPFRFFAKTTLEVESEEEMILEDYEFHD